MKLLIVDDDDIIRSVIRKTVVEEQLGFHWIEEADNGEAAAEKALRIIPEIIITDIRMPGADGLQFIEQTRKELQESKFIILSGYDDFTYAQKAIKFGVCEYLLKPYSRDELVALLRNYINIIECEKELRDRSRNIRNLFYSQTGSQRDKLLEKAVEGKERFPDDLKGYISDVIGFDIKGDLYSLIYVDIDKKEGVCREIYAGDMELMTFAVKNITAELASESFTNTIFINNSSSVVLLLSHKGGKQEFEPKIQFLSEKIRYMVRKFLHHSVTVCVSGMTEDFGEMPRFYREAQETVQLKLFKGCDCTLKSSMLTARSMECIIDGKSFEGILESITAMDEVKLNFEIEGMFAEISRSCNLSPLSVKKAVSRLAVYVYNGICVQGILVDEIFGDDVSCWNTLIRIEVLHELKNWTKGFFQKILEKVRQQKEDRLGKNVTIALKYIQEHYHQDLTLEGVAEKVRLNANYFSELFKKEVGMNFIDYVTGVRIEAAKQLLSRGNGKISQVAKAVGYKNPDYFCKVFKRMTGETPRSYK